MGERERERPAVGTDVSLPQSSAVADAATGFASDQITKKHTQN